MKLLKVCTVTLFATCLATGCKFGSKTTADHEMALSKNQEVHLCLTDKTNSFDPRLTRGMPSGNIVRLLFTGLTYVDENGKVFPGIAQNIHISPDMKTYTFTLRECTWSNGDQVKAQDFEYAWKTSLNPEMKSPMAYMLFAIKGAKGLFEGSVMQDEMGCKATDDKTLVVTLENPTPYFLQLTATPAYFPVNKAWVQANPDFKEGDTETCVSNGPFKIAKFTPANSLELVKNELYWGKEMVKLNKVTFSLLDDHQALASFQKGELDWVGAPLSILGPEGINTLKQSGQFRSNPAAGTQFMRVNVDKAPLNSLKFRKALLLAIDSQAIVTTIMQGGQSPAIGFVPPVLGVQQKSYFIPHDVEGARRTLEEALIEMAMSRNDPPTITLSYISSERAQKIAETLQQNWKDAFNLQVNLEGSVATSFYDKIFSKDYDLAMGSWFADFFDPMSFLSVFQYKENGTNNTGWENPDYTRLLEQSNLEVDTQKRLAFLQQAEEILMTDLPLLPIFHFSFTHGKNDLLQDYKLSPMGYIDLEDAYIMETPQKEEA